MVKVPPLKSPINEDSIEQVCISWFEQLGYRAMRAMGAVVSQSVKTEILKSQLYRINPEITNPEVTEVLQVITDLNDDKNLFSRNRTAHHILINGVKVTRLVGDEEQTHIVHLIDFKNPENNDFAVVSQLSVQGRFEKRRPDLIIYLNGLPVSVIELKDPTNQSATLDRAYNQIQTYQSQIDDIFTFNVVNVLSDGIQTGVGSITADFSRYHAWRKDENGNEKGWQLENLINGLFSPVLFLDYLRYFVIFEQPSPDKIIKKVAAYHQFYGVRKAVTACISAYTQKTGKSGVFWHTQGSGKSISMVFYVAKLQVEMNNPTFVIVTDRSDLDRQLCKTFKSAYDIIGHIEHADSRQDLREYLNARLSGGILFTTIQKFALKDNEDTFPRLNNRHNIVVIADEAHRSQYGHIKKYNADKQKYTYGTSQHMHDAMPNANFIGFTGTPIDLDDRSTKAVFGDYVDIYDINDAVQDKATVELYYEGRLVKLHQSEKISEIDHFVDDLLDTPNAEKAKRKWSAIAQVAGAPDRMAKIAQDITEHFTERQLELNGKALCVAMTRENCVALYNALTHINPDWHSDDINTGKIKVVMTANADDNDNLKKHKYTKQSLQTIENRFKDPNNQLHMVIVCDMWLTGFDVPCANTLYIDKPMHGYTLMQAIARVNRVFGNKPSGLIVDYIGIAPKLQQATKTYTAANGKGKPTIDIDEAKKICHDSIDICRELLHDVAYNDIFASNPVTAIKECTDYLFAPEKQREKKAFCQHVTTLVKAYTLCGLDSEIRALGTEIAFYRAVRAVLTKTADTPPMTDKETESILRCLMNDVVTVKQGEYILSLNELAGINGDAKISILDEKFLKQVADMPEKNLALELLRRTLQREISDGFKSDIVMEKKFSDMLIKTIQDMNEQAISTAEALNALIQMAQEINAAYQRGEELGLTPTEMAFYNAICYNKSAVENMEDDILIELARKIRSDLAKLINTDWHKREDTKAHIRLKIKRLLRTYKYPPDKQESAIELVLQQAIVATQNMSAK